MTKTAWAFPTTDHKSIKSERPEFSGEIKDISVVQSKWPLASNSKGEYIGQHVYEISCTYKSERSAYWRHFKGDISTASPIKSAQAFTKALRLILANIPNGDIPNGK